jgi:hypothetical protein
MDWNSPPKVNSDSAVRGFFYLVAVWEIGVGIFSLYAGVVGADVFFVLGVGAYFWIGIGHLGVGLLLLLAVYFRPRWFGIATR